MSYCGSPLLDPKKLQNEQFYIIDWIWKKLLVDVANLATCCPDDYDVLLEVLGTLGKCYVSSPVAKTLKIMTGTTVFGCLSGCSPLLDPKKLQNQQFYKIDWIRKNSWSMLPIWLLAAMMIMMYYWRFWEPWANAMLVVLLPKLWKSWLAQLFLDVFLWLTLTGPKKASKPTILHNRLNKEKNSWSMLPLWLLAAMMITMCYWRFWETLSKCYVSQNSGLPKLWTIVTGTTVFGCLPGAHPYWIQKSFKTNNFTK